MLFVQTLMPLQIQIQKNELRFTDDNSYKFYTNQIKSLGIKIDEKNYKIAAKILSKQFYME